MAKNDFEFINSLLRSLTKIDYIRPSEVPSIDLYMDQVTTFMDAHLSDIKRFPDDKILTKTMINNYTKNELLPPPVKKKYSHDHVYILIFIYYFKNILSISDIQKLLDPLTANFFGNSNTEINLSTIYKEVYAMQREQMSVICKDVYKKFESAKKRFDNITDEREKEFLQYFAFVCLLSWDIYVKKNMILGVIDKMNTEFVNDDSKTKAKSKEKPSKEKVKEKPSKKTT